MPAILLLIALFAAGHIETGEACRKKMDLLFDLDSSATVCGGNESCENWATVLQFCQNVTTTLDIGPGLTVDRVALTTVHNSVTVEWNLKKYTAMNPLLSAIGGVAFKGGVFTDVVSSYAVVTGVFSPTAGDDTYLPFIIGLPARQNVIIAITDGIPIFDDTTVKLTSLGIQSSGTTFFVICITSGTCTESWAKAAASTPLKDDLKTYFLVDSYSSLNNTLSDTVLKNICYFLENPSLIPTPIVEVNLNLTVG